MSSKKRKAPPVVQAVERRSPWDVIYYAKGDQTVPAATFLDGCPGKLDSTFTAVLDAVAAGPPPSFSGGGKWEAMHGDMSGWYEIRLTGPNREQFRLFCLLENGDDQELLARGLKKPAVAVICGLRKRHLEKFSPLDYAGVRKLGSDHQSQYPRRIAK